MNATGKRFLTGWVARLAVLLLLFGLPALAGVSPVPDAASGNTRVSERLFGLPGLSNVGRVAPGIYRGAQPEHEGYATLKAMGVRTVVNLRQRHGEKEAVEAAGMRYVEIPLSFLTMADPADVRKAVSVMSDPANQPVFLHCSVGTDRTGVVVAVYRMEVEGWSKAEALAEMEAFGFHWIWFRLKETIVEWTPVPPQR